MQFESKRLLRIFMGEQAKHHHRPLYEAIIAGAKERSLAGATVFKGILSYGMSGTVHTAKILELSQSLPVVVEIIDTEEKIEEFLRVVGKLVEESGTHVHVTLQDVESTVILPEK